MKSLKLKCASLLITPCIALIAGCATPAQPKGMIAQTVPQVQKTHAPVLVVVTGGGKTDPMWVSKIAAEDFRTALIESVRKSGLFHSVDESGNQAYQLEVRLEVLDQPLFGFDMTVALRADWRLVELKENRELWHERVLSSHTSTVGDAFSGTTRLRLANEGAARKNIEQGLARLAALDFKE